MTDLEEPPMDSVEQVMKGLTKAQRTTLLECPTTVDESYRPLITLRALGLISTGAAKFGVVNVNLTKRGLEVRARLLSSGGEG